MKDEELLEFMTPKEQIEYLLNRIKTLENRVEKIERRLGVR